MARSDHCQKLLDKLNKQREAGFLCDCTILIDDFQYTAHKNVLASFSEYFRALFHNNLDSIVHLDQKSVTPAGFQTMLDFVYSGDLHFNRCNIKEIYTAAEFLRVDEVISLCIPKMATTMAVTSSITEVPLDKDFQDTHEASSAYQKYSTTNTDKTDAICLAKKTANKKSLRSKKWKWTILSHKRCLKKVSEQQNPLMFSVLSMDETLAENPPQVKDNCLLSVTTSLNCGKEDHVVQPQEKYVKSKENSTLKEHYISNIAGGADICKIEGMKKGIEQKYFNNKPTCSICCKIFSEGSSLRRHMRIHKGVKPYVCHLCGKAFTQCNQLKTHVRTHTGEKPYQCKLCNKGFAQKCQLVFHRRMHHGEEKPYKCDVCNLQFATSSNLKIHCRKHSGEKPYVCDRCGQRFAQASTLTYHVRRHTGEKPYVCDTCGKAFAVSSSLITHARKHTGNEEDNESETIDGTVSNEDIAKESPATDSLDLKPSELFLHIGQEDNQTLLAVADNQSLSSESLLRTSAANDTEPQFIYLHQIY